MGLRDTALEDHGRLDDPFDRDDADPGFYGVEFRIAEDCVG
jgi:hypothetical protein